MPLDRIQESGNGGEGSVFELGVERCEADTEGVSGDLLVAAGLIENPADVVALEVSSGPLEIAVTLRTHPEQALKNRRVENRAGHGYERPLDYVA